MLRTISLGAGVQSTTLALMAAAGELSPMPDCAIFADTGWEPRAVYNHLKVLVKALPFPVYLVSAGDIRDHILRNSNVARGRFASVPWFTENGGASPRQCTREFKVEPIEKKQRELLGYAPRKRIPPNSSEVWIGISTDEAIRMKPARNAWQVNRWPLIERGISRRDCIAWLESKGWSAPKSSCIGCPYHSDIQWRYIRDNDPEAWADAILVDASLRKDGPGKGMRHRQFMHRSLVPLSQVDLRTHAELGQPDLFLNECEGMCGV